MNKKHLLRTTLYIVFFFLSKTTHAQYISITEPSGNESAYKFELFRLRPPARTAFYTHFWWFGDNGFSFDSIAYHSFSRSTQCQVFALTTENYGTGGAPPRYADTTFTPNEDVVPTPEILENGQYLRLQHYRGAVPGDTMYIILTYKNPTDYYARGRITLSLPPSTAILSDMISEFRASFNPNGEVQSGNTWNFDYLPANAERSILIPVRIDEDAEINEELSFSAQLWIDGASNLKMVRQILGTASGEEIILTEGGTTNDSLSNGEPIANYPLAITVANSHDPNKIVESSNAHNDCLYGGKTIEYTVHFQNVGDGPTHFVSVAVHLDDDVDMNTIRDIIGPIEYNGRPVRRDAILGHYRRSYGPVYNIDEARRILFFEFHDLQLRSPLSDSTMNLDFTQSFVKFKIDVNEGYEFGPPIKAQATIIFDENAPINTGIAYTFCNQPIITHQDGAPYPSGNTNDDGAWYNSLCCWLSIILALLLLILIIICLRRRKKKD